MTTSAMGITRSAVFFYSFLISGIPIWFVIAVSFINGAIEPEPAAAIIAGIVICRSYIESEIAGKNFFNFMALRIRRFFTYVFGIAAVYAVLIYFAFGADQLNKALIALALIIAVCIYYGVRREKTVRILYKKPFRVSFITTLLWFYIAFAPDTPQGKLSILAAVYIVEFINFFRGNPRFRL